MEERDVERVVREIEAEARGRRRKETGIRKSIFLLLLGLTIGGVLFFFAMKGMGELDRERLSTPEQQALIYKLIALGLGLLVDTIFLVVVLVRMKNYLVSPRPKESKASKYKLD